ncbi:hypothetical protein EQM14_10990 [Caproiciproducens sp. NJN-50]|uniref:hypothetical protein n=1 Tax=Caproiciproducens sp. NJN-50 TaxID=2507162 RepID=UPI000FFE23B8|nr:hypothetical protein [Caproiciproducens sp. NJN-50]QAT50246.1 hypothetical protein EQM14_10990 [Caproiciproducens sp. NJN-50]
MDADIASSKTTSIKDSDLQYLETAFSILMEAPDEFLKTASDTEIRDYFKLKGLEFKTQKELMVSSNEITTQDFWDGAKCAAAITVVIGGTVFAGAKLLKIRKYVKAIGGVKKAAAALIAYAKAGNAIPPNVKADVGKSIQKLAEEVLGIATIQEYCFGG